MTKECFRCHGVKDLDEFYLHPQMKDGHLNKCKECSIQDSHSHRKNNLDRVRAYDRARGSTKDRMEANRTRDNRPSRRVASLKWSQNNRDKRNARQIVSRAILKGTLTRATECNLCHSACKTQAHHVDYSQPMLILWVCDACHKKIHKTARENARNQRRDKCGLLSSRNTYSDGTGFQSIPDMETGNSEG